MQTLTDRFTTLVTLSIIPQILSRIFAKSAVKNFASNILVILAGQFYTLHDLQLDEMIESKLNKLTDFPRTILTASAKSPNFYMQWHTSFRTF